MIVTRPSPSRLLPVGGLVLLTVASACGGSQKPAVQNPASVQAGQAADASAQRPLRPARVPQESLREYIPERAVAAAILRHNALRPLRELFTLDPAMQQELGAYLRQNLGVDLTELTGVVFFATVLDPTPRGAVVLRLPDRATAKLPVSAEAQTQPPLPPHLGVPLTRLSGEVAAAALPGALVLGTADAVREAIAVSKGQAPSLSPAAPLAPLLTGDPRLTDVEIGVAASGVADRSLQAGLARFGASGARLTYEAVGSGRLALVIQGQPDKLTLAKGLLMMGIETGLKELESKKETAKLGSDIGKAAGMIIGYHYGRRLAQELEPRIEGNEMIFRYDIPASLYSGVTPYMGVLAAMAIPAFERYMNKAKAASAPIATPPRRGL